MIPLWASSRGVPASFPGLAAWYRFGLGITSAGGFVSQWNDQSGNARHLLQATGAAQPALQGDGSILFDGIAHFMQAASFGLVQPVTAYMRGRQVTWTINDRLFDGAPLANGLALFQSTATPGLGLATGATFGPDNNLAINTYGTVAVVSNGAGSLIQVNSNAPTTGAGGANNPGGFTVAAAGNGSANWGNLQVKEIAVYAAAHDQSTRDTIIAYLNTL